VIRHANGSPGWDSSPNPLRVGGRAATRIRRPRAIDPISRPSVAVSLGRPRSKDPPAPWDRSLLLFVGAQLDSVLYMLDAGAELLQWPEGMPAQCRGRGRRGQ